jgi:hypothetical protein
MTIEGISDVTATKRVLFAGAALALTAHGAAMAQSLRGTLSSSANQPGENMFARDRNVSVMQRQHPGYEALGVREGAFMLWPKLNANAEYNSNIFATESDKVADTIFHVAPEVDLSSNWSRHSLQAYARGVFNQYAQNSDQNTNDYSVGAIGQLDVLRSAQVNSGLDYSRYTEPRTSAGSEGEPFPVQYTLASAYLSGARTFNRLRLSGRFDWKKFDYQNRTGNFPQDDRDRTLMIGTVRADYAVSPDTAVFVEVAGNDRDYRLSSSPIVSGSPEFPNFINRDSHGVEFLAGANFELAALVRGEIGLGYMKQNYKDSAFHDYSGLGARAQVEWFPTQLATVTFTGSRTVEDSAIIGSSSYIATNLGAQVDYELLRNLIISANASYGDNDYKGVDRTDKMYGGGVSANYLLNRNVGLSLAYNHLKQDSSGTDASVSVANFSVDKVAVTLTLQY